MNVNLDYPRMLGNRSAVADAREEPVERGYPAAGRIPDYELRAVGVSDVARGSFGGLCRRGGSLRRLLRRAKHGLHDIDKPLPARVNGAALFKYRQQIGR